MKYALIAALLLSGCEVQTPGYDQPIRVSGPDQCLRAELFQQCLKNAPAGPAVTGKYNDWDEVVDSCEDAAYRQAWRPLSAIKPECLAQ